MVNEFGKMSNLNTFHLRRYVDRWKKTERQTRTEIWIPLQSWWFPSRKHWTSSVMVRFMKGVHEDINQTFSTFNQGTVRPYHGTMPAVVFFKHTFHCSIVDNPVNDACVVDSIEISAHSLSKAWEITKYHEYDFSRPFLCTLSCTNSFNLNSVH